MAVFNQEHCQRLFETFSGNGASSDPAWLRDARQASIQAFAELGFPTTRQEEWRFTNVKSVLGHAFTLAESAPQLEKAVLDPFRYSDNAIQLVVVNGRFDPALSDLTRLPNGVIATGLRSALVDHEGLVRSAVASTDAPKNGFEALNGAFLGDGLFVHVPRGVTVGPEIHLTYLTVADGQPVMTTPQTVVVAEDETSVCIVETYAGLGEGAYLTNANTTIRAGNGAAVTCYRVQRETLSGFHVASTASIQERDSRYVLVTVSLGGQLSRHDVRMVMNGEGGEGRLDGLYVMRDRQHVDHQTVIEHAKPHCQSFEYFNGILDDRARAVFNGRIIVRPGAQKTDSKQTNNNLLLSESARADSQPQLEIYADDVRCTHGATLGPLDRQSLFYLQTRGINADAARRLLTYGFSRQILDGIESDPVRTVLERLVIERLDNPAQ